MFVVVLIIQIGIFPFTLLLPNTPELIAWLPTVYHGITGIVMLLTGLLSRRGLIGLVKPQGIVMPASIWPRIDRYFSIVFLLLAISNACFVVFGTESQWVRFSVLIPFPYIVICTVIVSLMVSRDIMRIEREGA